MEDSRPGSGATLAAVVFAALFPTLATWLYFVVLPESRWMVPVYAGCKVVQFAFPLLWLKRRPLIPPGRGGVGKGLLFGLLSGLGISGFLFLVWEGLLAGGPLAARAAQTISAKLAGFGIATPGGYLLLVVFYSVFHSLLEEYYWRWFVFGRLRRFLPATTAAVLSSLAFMAHHVIVVGELAGAYDARTWLLASTVGVGGLIFAWLYHRSRLLYGPWLSHALVDAALLWIGYGLWR